MPSRTRHALLAGALLLAVGAPPAVAAPAPLMQTFDVTIRGSEVATWSLREVDDPDDPCDAPASGDGSQMVRFFSKKTRVQVMRAGAEVIVAQAIPAPVSVEREGDLKSAPVTGDCPPVAIGDNGGTEKIEEDCGLRRGKIDLRMQFGDPVDDDLLVPLVTKDALTIEGDFGSRIIYSECPWWPSGAAGPREQGISTAARKFNVDHLFDRRRKVLRSSADLTKRFTGPGFTGKTLLTWNVKMVRVRG